ncbi:FAD-dependent oxidoreductase [Leptolyngbya cf. ectocarpi LEGE 11479]|uniref:FAD-dependent oxidoreductase n=1 Tax=Leptolyngbya cf. ectocarpi LEGE 11479 TaxID=1828722 RepID=A0A928ZTU9_LEPEC|nr:FAD-dependent oxidoreductase [Leptolyngbya ectocarpi]MBE9067345.1 FAD-dependent oxidoreductase [Leptolyngbya cf. ectocarpi LEGE 11479]
MVQQQNGLLSDDALTRPENGATYSCSIAIIGGSTAAYTTALTALKLKLDVCLVQPQRMVGGQFTAQALPASDDGDLLRHQANLTNLAGEEFAISKSQRLFRQRQRQLQPVSGRVVKDPGGSWVCPLSTTPVVASMALNEPLMPYLKSGKLTLIPYAEPTSLLLTQAEDSPRRVTGVACQDTRTQHSFTVKAQVVIEATDFGDLLELANLPSRVGQEARSDTGEAILPEEARPECQQSFTFDVVVERTYPGKGVPVPAPTEYGRVPWLNIQEFTGDFWVRKNNVWKKRDFFHAFGIFRYRRLKRRYLNEKLVSPGDVAVINWGTSNHPQRGQCCGNDYRTGYLIGLSRSERQQQIQRARIRAQAYIHYLQVSGVSDLKPRGDLTWTKDGIALEPYIREARRGIALTTIRHEDVAASFFPNQARARTFDDTLGIGQYHYLDLHGNLVEGHVNPRGKDVIALPFTLPATSLVPVDTDGLVLSAKSIGTTHITNAAYRMHPVEWAIGEASGFLAAFSVWTGKQPREIVSDESLLCKLQGFVTRNGIPIVWFDDVSHRDSDFEAIQVMAAAGIITSENAKNLHFRPHGSVSRAVVCTALVNLLGLEKITPEQPSFKDVQPGRHWAYSTVETLKATGMVAGMRRGVFAPDQAMTRKQLGFLVKQAMPQAYGAAFANTPRDQRIVQRRDLARVFYVLLKAKLAI